MMSSYVAEKPDHNKRQKIETSFGISSLPDDLALNCLSRLSRLERAELSLVSKRHHSLVVSPELYLTRSLMGCTEKYYYVCISFPPELTPRWFILPEAGNRRLRAIPSYPYQAPESSSFVVMNYGIYVIGGMINGLPTWEVLFLDCLLDGKIYVFGGCGETELDSSSWGEVFDPKTQTWDTLSMPEDPEICKNTRLIKKSVVMEDSVYASGEEGRCFNYLPREGVWRIGSRDSKRGNRKDWCAIGKLLYCSASCGKILWCEPGDMDWKEVKGFYIMHRTMYGLKTNNSVKKELLVGKFHVTEKGFVRLISNSRGNIMVFWKVFLPSSAPQLELWCAEISLEPVDEGQIWGTIEWADEVSKLDHLSPDVNLLYAVSVNV